MIFYTADDHFGHENILKLSKRPFKTVDEMDNTLIDNINKVVGLNDDIYFLGDVTFKGGDPIKYLSRINGKKHLVIGNHDKAIMINPEARKFFVEIRPYIELYDNGRHVILCHYPMAEWNGYFRGSYHLFGHVHNNFDNPWHKYMTSLNNCWNVGVDVTNYAPVTLDQLIKRSD